RPPSKSLDRKRMCPRSRSALIVRAAARSGAVSITGDTAGVAATARRAAATSLMDLLVRVIRITESPRTPAWRCYSAHVFTPVREHTTSGRHGDKRPRVVAAAKG